MSAIFWRVKGYNGVYLTKERLQDKKYSLDEIKKKDASIIEQIKDNLEAGGVIFGLEKKGNIKTVYLFKLSRSKKLVFDKKFVLPEVEHCIEEFEKDFKVIFNEVLRSRHDIEKIVWNETEITHKENWISLVSSVRAFVWIGIIMSIIFAVVTVACSSLYSVSVFSNPNKLIDLEQDKSLINYVAYINDYSYIETIDYVTNIENVRGMVVVNIILPSLARVAGYIFLIFALKGMLALIGNFSDKKMFFTGENGKKFKVALIICYIAMLLMGVDLYVWILLSVIPEFLIYLFDYCIYLTSKENA